MHHSLTTKGVNKMWSNLKPTNKALIIIISMFTGNLETILNFIGSWGK